MIALLVRDNTREDVDYIYCYFACSGEVGKAWWETGEERPDCRGIGRRQIARVVGRLVGIEDGSVTTEMSPPGFKSMK